MDLHARTWQGLSRRLTIITRDGSTDRYTIDSHRHNDQSGRQPRTPRRRSEGSNVTWSSEAKYQEQWPSMRPSRVFLNVPFDPAYEPFFVAIITAVVAVGRAPRCVLELPEKGTGRLARLLRLVQSCDISIHDLSRVGLPARFNMPFELGLACAVSALSAQHNYVLLERQPYRLDKTLSDIKGRDPYIYRRSRLTLIGNVLDALGRASRPVPIATDVRRVVRKLDKLLPTLKQRRGTSTVFSRAMFLDIVTYATVLASDEGFIRLGAVGNVA